MLNEDLLRSFPRVLHNEISVHVIQSRGHILNTYDEALSKYAEERFAHDSVDVLTNARVKEVRSDKIIFSQKDESGQIVTKELPMGFCLWSTGVAQTEFCEKIAKKLGSAQTNRHALETDSHLRVVGTPLGDVYAIGDCSTVQNNLADHLTTFLRTKAWEKGKDPESMAITFQEWRHVAAQVKKRFPQAAGHLKRLDKLFEAYDKDKSGTLDFGEMHELLVQIDKKLTSLPATAQRANQQGQYLGKKFNKIAAAIPGLRANQVDYGDLDEAVYKAFEYFHMGSLAYIGNAAIFDFGGFSFGGGLVAVYLWRSIYFAQSVSLRTRILLAMDWTKRALFGRGMSHVPLVRPTYTDQSIRLDDVLESDIITDFHSEEMAITGHNACKCKYLSEEYIGSDNPQCQQCSAECFQQWPLQVTISTSTTALWPRWCCGSFNLYTEDRTRYGFAMRCLCFGLFQRRTCTTARSFLGFNHIFMSSTRVAMAAQISSFDPARSMLHRMIFRMIAGCVPHFA